ncbi:hypothetical protein BD309DRAFT_295227 [Dichomitus squalens]|nr:hypothetical protein BD309DRAFT_295227 [Dichomitus squalens]
MRKRVGAGERNGGREKSVRALGGESRGRPRWTRKRCETTPAAREENGRHQRRLHKPPRAARTHEPPAPHLCSHGTLSCAHRLPAKGSASAAGGPSSPSRLYQTGPHADQPSDQPQRLPTRLIITFSTRGPETALHRPPRS